MQQARRCSWCAEYLRKKDGSPDFTDRRFCGAACRGADKAARMRAEREIAQRRRVATVREKAVAHSLPQQREWFVVRGVRIGIFSAAAFQYFIKHPDRIFAGVKPRPLKVVARKAG